MKRNLKQELKAFYQSIPPMPNADLAVQLTKRAGRNALTPPKNFSLYQFIRTQARFLNRKLLALQLLLLCLYALYTIAVLQDNDRFLLFVPIAPLAVLLGTGRALPFFPLRNGRTGITRALFTAANPFGKADPDNTG